MYTSDYLDLFGGAAVAVVLVGSVVFPIVATVTCIIFRERAPASGVPTVRHTS